MCSDMTSSEVERKSCHQLFAIATRDVIADIIHMNDKLIRTNDVTHTLSPWSTSHEVNSTNKLHSNSRIQRMMLLEDKLKDEKSCHVADENNMASATGKKSKGLLNNPMTNAQNDDDVSFCHYDDRSEHIKQYRRRRQLLRSYNTATNTQLPPNDDRSNYGLHHVIIDSPCKPIRSHRTPGSSRVPNLPSIFPPVPHNETTLDRFDWALMTSYGGLQRHLADIRTIDILIKSLSSDRRSRQVWFDEQGTAYITLSALKCLPARSQTK